MAYVSKEFDESTKNSELAARALGCTVAEIAKSVVFMGEGPVVVVIAGDRRVDLEKLQRLVGSKVRRATPDEVRDGTGYPIGGVPPFPHSAQVKVFFDRTLNLHLEVWAAGGTPNSVFKVSPGDMVSVAGASTVDVSA
ncbi:MAG TPA: YbaK/EbsC family protein [Nitrososphaerales archaeon]|nr:YbaK/EbsC family protein [Nitrososphaerales archaeon]